MRHSIVVICLLCGSGLSAQTGDSLHSLPEVTVRGFENFRKPLTVPASVSVVGSRDLQRYASASLVPSLNMVPGVRMEERSPGSYRLSIRGSLLRSPFGVRNVKIYWKDMPLTDAGGNTYLNLLDINGIGRAELIRGPAGSIFGAGTGGVVTFQEPAMTTEKKNAFMVQFTGGSYGMMSANLGWQGQSRNWKWQFLQSHYQSDGYRENSRMRRDLSQFSIGGKTGEKNSLDALVLYGDLAYRTPGGLTLAQMKADPRQARPATAVLPSASQQKAGVYNKTFYAGVTNTFRFSEKWTNVSTITVTNTRFSNPFITNYEKRDETSWSIRSRFEYNGTLGGSVFQWNTGIEAQQTRSTIDSTGNNGGVPDNNLVRDKLRASQAFVFTQAEWQPGKKWVLHAGLSVNGYKAVLQRTIPQSPETHLDFNPQLLPRVAVLYRLSENLSVFTSAGKGYSPPTLAEIRPSAGGFSGDLQAEYGWNLEAGLRGAWWHSRVRAELTAFDFSLKDAIVRRTNASGAEYFVNAGGTSQKGLEAYGEAYLIFREKGFIRQLRLSATATLSHFRFTDYKSGNKDYSGNALTGVPAQVFVTALDLDVSHGFYFRVSFNYTSRLPLNDQNDTYASDYRLWQSRAGWKTHWKSGRSLEIFSGVDNMANGLYSLGNDINAFGKRYYNPAPGINYFGGIQFRF